jgi:hypothetical protein
MNKKLKVENTPILELKDAKTDITILNKEVQQETKVFDIEGKFLHIKVGTENSPAIDEQIEEINNKMVKLLTDNNIKCAVLVTHHAVEIKKIE